MLSWNLLSQYALSCASFLLIGLFKEVSGFNPVILLDRPSKGYVHTFDINGSVIVKFAEGTSTEEYRFSEETFKALFDDQGLETIKINKLVSEQVINVTVQVKWQGNVEERTFVHGEYTEAGILDLVAQMAEVTKSSKDSRPMIYHRIADVVEVKVIDNNSNRQVLCTERIPIYQYGKIIEVPISNSK